MSEVRSVGAIVSAMVLAGRLPSTARRMIANGIRVSAARVHSSSMCASKCVCGQMRRLRVVARVSRTIRMVEPMVIASPGSTATRAPCSRATSRTFVRLMLPMSSISNWPPAPT